MDKDIIWGQHPFFYKMGLHKEFMALCDKAPDAFDKIEIIIKTPDDIKIYLSRRPSFDIIPLNEEGLGLPDIRERNSLVGFEELDEKNSFKNFIADFIRSIPYDFTKEWHRGQPRIILEQNNASLKINAEKGEISIYSEGREKTDKSSSFWTNRASYYPRKHTYTFTDILLSDGIENLIIKQMREDERLLIRNNPKLVKSTMYNSESLFSLEFELDFMIE